MCLEMKSNSTLVNIFKKFTTEILNKGNDHGYLEGTIGIVDSKVYMDGIYDEVNLCKKYFKKFGKILDFGAGAGLHSWLLSNNYFEVYGIDIDNFGDFDGNTRETLNMSRDQKLLWKKLMNKNNLNLSHYSGKIPFENNFFDGVIASAVIEHIPNKNRKFYLKEILRVLKPGGYLLVSRLPRKYSYTEALCRLFGLGHHQELFTKNESIKMLNAQGFKIEKFWITDFFPSYPLSISNRIYPLFKAIEPLLLKLPFRYLSHDIRILAKKL